MKHRAPSTKSDLRYRLWLFGREMRERQLHAHPAIGYALMGALMLVTTCAVIYTLVYT